jgi:hypothetical protein
MGRTQQAAIRISLRYGQPPLKTAMQIDSVYA